MLRLGLRSCRLALLWLLASCDADPAEPRERAAATAQASAASSAAVAKAGMFVLPPRPAFDSNPLRLSAPLPALEPDSLVYTLPARVLETARLGSSFALRAATAEGIEGGNVLVHMGREPTYPVHPAYVLVPRPGPLRRGAPVLAPYRGVLAHALVVATKRDQVVVRYVDAGQGYGEQPLRAGDVSPQAEGLRPGNYAVYREGEGYQHVLLVSSGSTKGDSGRWLVIGYGGESRLVEAARLQPVPLGFEPKAGADVRVAWLGTMVAGKVTAVDSHGLLTVRRAATAPALLGGPGLLMPIAP